MVSNPIQKKVRNAALIGSLVTLLIMGAIVAVLLFQLNKMNTEQKKIEQSFKTVYTLNQDVVSGQVITEDMFVQSTAQIEHIPLGATSDIQDFINYSLTDKEGNTVYTDEKGIYLNKNSEYMEIFQNGNKYYTYLSDGTREEVTGLNQRDIYTDDYRISYNDSEDIGAYVIRETEGKTRIYQEDATGEYYILTVRYDANQNGQPTREKQYVDIVGTPLIAKIDMNKNTVLTTSMLSKGSLITKDVRKQEYNVISLPVDLATGDYIDVRIQLPNGQDFIVVSKKEVEIPIMEGMDSENTVWINLSEDETLYMSCAIVEAFRINGSKIYATKYTDPGMQEAVTPTYPISAETIALIRNNPNVTDVAKQGLNQRYTQALVNIRENNINTELAKPENSESNITEKMNQSIALTQEERRNYLQSLANGGATN